MVQALGGVNLGGVTTSFEEFVGLPLTSTDPVAAINGADIVMVVVPAFGQRVYMELLAGRAHSGQAILFNPGKFASLEFADLVSHRDDLLFGDAETLIYASRIVGPARVEICGMKLPLPIAAHPALRTEDLVHRIRGIYPQVRAARSVLECAINDPAIVIHPVCTLLNASRIEDIGPYRARHYGVTQSVGRVIDALDNERVAIAEALGFPARRVVDVLGEIYGTTGRTAYETLLAISALKGLMSPSSLEHRYITEEIPFSLVPMIDLARLVGLATPGLESLVALAGLALGRDLRQHGRRLELSELQRSRHVVSESPSVSMP